MSKTLKYLAGMMLLAATVALLACTGDEPTAPAPVAEPTAPAAAATAMPAEPTPTEAMAAAPTEAMDMQAGSRLQTVMDRGHVICASRNDVPGYGFIDASGANVGFDIDLCRALAAAVLNDPSAIEIRLITAARARSHHPVR